MISETVLRQNWTPIPYRTDETQFQSQNKTNWNNHLHQFLPVLQKDKRRIKVNIVPSINQYMDLTWLIDQYENMNEMKCLNDNNDNDNLN